MRWPRCSLDSGLGLKPEVKKCRVRDALIEDASWVAVTGSVDVATTRKEPLMVLLRDDDVRDVGLMPDLVMPSLNFSKSIASRGHLLVGDGGVLPFSHTISIDYHDRRVDGS